MTAVDARAQPGALRLWAEMAVLFVGAPVAMALFFGQYPLFLVIWGLTGVALWLLRATPGFAFAELARGPVLGEWRLILGYLLLSALTAFAIAGVLVPERLLDLPRHRPGLWLMILALYPVLSAWPQEIIYRTLFFRRYGGLFPSRGVAVAVNGALFGLGHLFYQNPVTIGLTAVAGVLFALAYLRHGSTLLATVLHGLGGGLVFTAGLGVYFYHGAIGAN